MMAQICVGRRAALAPEVGREEIRIGDEKPPVRAIQEAFRLRDPTHGRRHGTSHLCDLRELARPGKNRCRRSVCPARQKKRPMTRIAGKAAVQTLLLPSLPVSPEYSSLKLFWLSLHLL